MCVSFGVGERGVIDCRRCAEWSRVAEGIDEAASCDGRGGLRFMHLQQSGPIAQPNAFPTFEPFLLDLVMSLASILLTISLRNSPVLSFFCANPAIAGRNLLLSQLVVTPVRFFFCGLGQRLRASWERRHCAGAECCATSRFRSRARVHAMIP